MFTDIKPVARPIVKLVDNLEPYWISISGFISAEGCFSINLRENVDYKAGYEAGLRFSLSKNAWDLELINKLKDFGLFFLYIKKRFKSTGGRFLYKFIVNIFFRQ